MATPFAKLVGDFSPHLCRSFIKSRQWFRKNNIRQWRQMSSRTFEEKYDYDMIVIGGGSGGLACSKEAALMGKKVMVVDYVSPSPRGSRWGIGGTCVNVGCIPKKLMHHASLLRESMNDAAAYGWHIPGQITLEWEKLISGIQSHVRSLNWGHRVQLKEKTVDYMNAKGEFVDQVTVKLIKGDGEEKTVTGETIVIAVGGRPKYPTEIPGALEYGISSDDIFSLERSPGKTLVIGGSYVALECAGFLNSLGFETTVMIRSIPLRGFDQQMARIVVRNMESLGTKVLQRTVPVSVDKDASGKIRAVWKDREGKESSDTFDTILFAVGREPALSSLHLRNAGIKVHSSSGKIITTNEQTSVRNIYAIGDVLHERPELTPVAIKAGKLLAHRLYANSTINMDYDKVPTTVFTPIEYSCVGLSEEQAFKQHGDDNVEIYHALYKPLEYCVTGRTEQCYIKMLCSSAKPQKVIGLHFIGPNAGEVIQGFATAMKCGLTKRELDLSVGIHPTTAEEIVKLHITKRSGLDPNVTQC